jgi:xanthine dehydrogenase small subunit
VATLGGNLGSASPIGDTLPMLMACNATVYLQSLSGRRTVNINSFITGYRQTVRNKDEIIVSVSIPRPSKDTVLKWYKISKRKDLDISTLSGGFRLRLESGTVREIILAFGGMAAQTKRALQAEKFLEKKEWSRENVTLAMDLIRQEFTPISDARAGAEMRRIAAGNLLMKFWSETKDAQINSLTTSIAS